MVLPLAQIVHSTNHRLRLRIKGRRGDDPYFSDLEAKLGVAFASFKVLASPVTGSIAVSGDRVEERAVCDFGRREALFRVAPAKSEPQTLPLSIIGLLRTANRNMRAATSGRLDLPSSLFVALLLFGIVELIRGNWKTPPWYTAFWYAFGLYSKSLFDQVIAMEDPGAGDE